MKINIDNSSKSVSSAGFFGHHGLWAPGVRLFRSLRFKGKAYIISLTFVLPLLFLIIWQMEQTFEVALQNREDSTRQNVEIANGIIIAAHKEEINGVLSREQAQNLAKNTISQLRYDGNEYFWINDMQARVVMHPINSELNGTDASNIKDSKGLYIFKAFVEKVNQSGKGFVAYHWPHPGHSEMADKISYVQGFAPWGWVVGSGIYIDDLYSVRLRQVSWVIFIVLLDLVIAGYLFISFYKVMNGGLHETRRHLRAMTEGDLTTSPAPWGTDDAAELMHELREMQDSLRSMVLRVRCSSQEIVFSSSEVASGSLDLSTRTEQTAANLEQSATSMEQISSTVFHNAEHVSEAADVAVNNEALATDGGLIMAQVVQTMGSISKSSEKIGDIIGTIDSIAFQTNLLALNAAVEAARAGSEGRGFSVVAAEVRSLAQRSATAAKEIKTLISQSVEQVNSGSVIVNDAGLKMEEIVKASKRIKGLLAEISNGAREQSVGISQIGQAVNELDRMTQQNAALVQETAAAANAMKNQALDLEKEVDRFNLPNEMNKKSVGVELIAPNFDFNKAIDAHRQWRVKFRQAIFENEKLDVANICRDDHCALGKWLHGAGGKKWGAKPEFKNLLEKHAHFHKVAGDVAQEINLGKVKDPEKIIGSGSIFSNVSNEVSTLLTLAKRIF